MVFKKGFFLIELMMSVFLVGLCVLLFITHYAQISRITYQTHQVYKITLILQGALEEARSRGVEYSKRLTIENCSVEVVVKKDNILKNFLHITATLYDEKRKKYSWFTGVALPHEKKRV